MAKRSKKIAVIGAGLGGLASAAMLASRGHHVDLFEKNTYPGGKIQEFSQEGYRFDAGPGLLTLPFVLEQVFKKCGEKASDYLEWMPVEPLCRYQFSDGTLFYNYLDQNKNRDELMRIAPEDIEAWKEFMDYTTRLYRHTSEAFIFNPLYHFRDLNLRNIPALFKIDAFRTVSSRVDRYFSSPRLRQLFKRFTTYNGSSPYLAPATLNVIPYVELRLGGFYIKGGMYELIRALIKLCGRCGVHFHAGVNINQILLNPLKRKCVSGIKADGKNYGYDAVISNSDATETFLKLLPEESLSSFRKSKISRIEPSCSGFVLMLGVQRDYEQLEHHNIFFSSQYKREFQSIFEEKELPEDPTIYLTNTSHTQPDDAPPGCSNFFILVNAPYTEEQQPWNEWRETYSEHLIQTLEKRGLEGLGDAVVVQKVITPSDFEEQFRSNRGSIYGTSSNNRSAAFVRPRNQSPWFQNLYLCGGSTHPGGGIPLVLQSALNVLTLFER